MSQNKYSLICFTFKGTQNQLHFLLLFIIHLISFFLFLRLVSMEYACLLETGSKGWASGSDCILRDIASSRSHDHREKICKATHADVHYVNDSVHLLANEIDPPSIGFTK